MNVIFYIVVILVQVVVIFYLVRRGNVRSKMPDASEALPEAGSFEGLRTLALHIKPSQLELVIPDSQTFVYGVVMDWNTGDAVITLASYITGAANLYISTGGGVNGGGKEPGVGTAAVALVSSAQDFIERALPSMTKEIPPEGCVRFYLLSNKGIYAAQEQVKYFDDGSSAWLSLFEKANGVIREMQTAGINTVENQN